MNKNIVIFCLLVLPLSMLFSQQQREYITFHSYAFAAFEPLQIARTGNEEPLYSAGIGSWDNEPHIEFRVTVNTPGRWVGGQVDFIYNTNTSGDPALRPNNNAEIWFQPFDWIRLDLGKFYIDTLRGKTGGSDFSRYLGPEADQESFFQRFVGRNGGGALFSITPIQNLFIGILINADIRVRVDGYRPESYQDGETIYRNGQYALAYTFPGIGQVAVQYIGGDTDVTISAGSGRKRVNAVNVYGLYNPMSLQAAFTFTAIQNLEAELGFTYRFLADEDKYQLQRPMGLALGGDYTYGDFNISGRADISFLGREGWDQSSTTFSSASCRGLFTEHTNDFSIGLCVTPSYEFDFARLGMDFLTYYKTATKCNVEDTHDDDVCHLGFALWMRKRFGSANFRAGCTFAMPMKWEDVSGDYRTVNGPFIFTVPIMISYYI